MRSCDDRRARLGDAKRSARGVSRASRCAAAPGVAERLLARLGRLALGVQLLRRAVAVVGVAVGHQALGVLAIEVVALRLAVGRRPRRPLVPVEAEPAQARRGSRRPPRRWSAAIGVLDAEDEGAPVVARAEPVEERRAGATDVEVSGGAGGEANADAIVRFRHNDVLYPPAAETRSAAGSPGRAHEAAHELRAREVVSSARRADPIRWRRRRDARAADRRVPEQIVVDVDRPQRRPTPPAASAAAGA